MDSFADPWMTSSIRALVPAPFEPDLPGRTANVHRAVLVGTDGGLLLLPVGGGVGGVGSDTVAVLIDPFRSRKLMCRMGLSTTEDGGDLAIVGSGCSTVTAVVTDPDVLEDLLGAPRRGSCISACSFWCCCCCLSFSSSF